MRKAVLLVFFSCLMVTGFACRPVNYVVNTSNYSTTVTRDISLYEATTKEVRSAITKACVSLTWKPKDKGSDTIRAVIQVRHHTVIVDIAYTTKSYSIKYVSSINMDATPEGKIHPNYNNWVVRLADTIDRELTLQNL